MDIKPIKTRTDYRAALKDIERLMLAEAGTPEGERLDLLTTLVEAYERKHFPMDLPDAVEAIKFRMEQPGLTPKDLVPLIGRLNRVYEVPESEASAYAEDGVAASPRARDPGRIADQAGSATRGIIGL